MPLLSGQTQTIHGLDYNIIHFSGREGNNSTKRFKDRKKTGGARQYSIRTGTGCNPKESNRKSQIIAPREAEKINDDIISGYNQQRGIGRWRGGG
jgi:hypothetical protein